MGLINKNYKINGYEYPTVYAVFNGEIKKLGNDLEVSFNVHGTRELALTEKPLEVKKVRIKDWDRKTDLITYAYQKGKEKIPYETYNEKGELVTVEKDNVFTGWDDDIQE
jgi:hypothetical protein